MNKTVHCSLVLVLTLVQMNREDAWQELNAAENFEGAVKDAKSA
jgi:hypothetical protein